jgi:glycosyltransferase involved in cell wall biosynthesis
MRVGISLLTLAPSDLGGSETYARQLVRALSRVGSLEYAVLVPARAKDAAEGLPAIEVKDPPIGRRGPSRIPAMAFSARRTRGLGAKVADLDVVHYALTVPVPRTNVPTVVTLHDIQHRDLPDFFGPARRSFRRVAYDRAARGATAVVVTSEFVRGRALELLSLAPDRVHVIPLAVDHTLFRPGDEEREPFLLYPARPWPHKNHTRLFEAFALLRETRPRLRLVLTGGGLERFDPLPDGVERMGVVSTTELASLYRRAACLVYPSLYEGFGMPPLEAMASGCPVAAADAGAIPEVCGDVAVLFDPTDVESIAAGILAVDERREELSERGLARAAGFTWDETAREHEAVYVAAAQYRSIGEAVADDPDVSKRRDD